MSTLIPQQILSPINRLEECAQFVIDDTREKFTFFDVTVAAEKYTLSFWVRSEEPGGLIVHGENISTNTEWKKYVTTFIAEGNDLEFGFGSAGIYYIYHPQLEVGGMATDWTTAIEDMANMVDLEKVRVDLVSAISDLSVTSEGITARVARVETSSQASIDSVRADMETLSSQVEMKMTAEDVKLEIQTELANGAGKVVTNTGYTFDDEGLTVEKTGSQMKTQITDNGMTVYQSGEEVLVANNKGVDAKDLHATTFLIIGNRSRFEKYGEGRIGCFWIGG